MAFPPAFTPPFGSESDMPPPGWRREPSWIAKVWQWVKRSYPNLLVAILLLIGYFSFREILNIFAYHVASHWVTLLEGSAGTVALMAYQGLVQKKPLSRAWWVVVFLVFLFFACFQAWEDEYKSKLARQTDLHNAELNRARLQGQIDAQGVPQIGPQPIVELGRLITAATRIQDKFIASNDTSILEAGNNEWTTTVRDFLDSRLGASYALEFKNALPARMGCIEGSRADGCDLYRQMQGRKEKLMSIMGDLR